MKFLKRLFCFVACLGALAALSPLNAEVIKSDKELGKCEGSIPFEPGMTEPTPEMQRLAEKCEQFDNEKASCEKESDCMWSQRPMVCESNRSRESNEEAEFCEQFSSKEQCEENSFKCEWGYKAPVCNPLDPNNQEDLEFCERFDSNEGTCERHDDRCDWG